jgi:hypothetical protein
MFLVMFLAPRKIISYNPHEHDRIILIHTFHIVNIVTLVWNGGVSHDTKNSLVHTSAGQPAVSLSARAYHHLFPQLALTTRSGEYARENEFSLFTASC